ncbi:unnamed protein product [Sphagnum troendelagicum]|uniref:Uncharacterized protein n=1 Tax=Sphagnum troendelagicum TaxID=128251 RepID=A0ABP0UU50_9BRYO
MGSASPGRQKKVTGEVKIETPGSNAGQMLNRIKHRCNEAMRLNPWLLLGRTRRSLLMLWKHLRSGTPLKKNPCKQKSSSWLSRKLREYPGLATRKMTELHDRPRDVNGW